MGIRSLAIALALLLTSCAEGHCRRKGDSPELAAQPAAPLADAKPGADARIFVYKYDGSLQCGMGKPISLEAMAKELQGVTIHAQNKKRDGLMHIQVCGSITGMANVYEIPAVQQKMAETQGFKKWSFE